MLRSRRATTLNGVHQLSPNRSLSLISASLGDNNFLLTLGRLVRCVWRTSIFGAAAINSCHVNVRSAESVMALTMKIGLARGWGRR